MSGYSKRTLWQKLGYKENFLVRLIDPMPEYQQLLTTCPPFILTNDDKEVDLIHLFIQEKVDLHYMIKHERTFMKSNGMLWVSWPKTKSKIASDIKENDIRQEALAIDLVDIKVCAVDEDWSALKLVIRKHLRN